MIENLGERILIGHARAKYYTTLSSAPMAMRRRLRSKPYVPYRGDDSTIGRRTGIHIPAVNRIDGFELFEEIMDQGPVYKSDQPSSPFMSGSGNSESDGEDVVTLESRDQADVEPNFVPSPATTTSTSSSELKPTRATFATALEPPPTIDSACYGDATTSAGLEP
ncbi:hypothetical protein B0H17DRAFT_504717 [Mycena rosella]|uniref:Uncharacterized protein n=1 Tax=Mycena rosella TaxID=1033263 RepID=A0AAD7FPJ5_MYCRO|nr:hypothetical protein B0H17DRAFT_504717 [Mycena rosella]